MTFSSRVSIVKVSLSVGVSASGLFVTFDSSCHRFLCGALFSYMSCLFQHVKYLSPGLPGTANRWGSPPRLPYLQKTGRDSVDASTATFFVRNALSGALSRKEVFQPHLPVRLPCYDLAPITRFTLGRSSRSRTSGTTNFHGLTGGVYKARERIHRAMADARLLANPTSRSRVADSDPN